MLGGFQPGRPDDIMRSMSRRFVVHAHTGHGPTHYDLMLQAESALATWQLPCRPDELCPNESVAARKLADHRAAYLTYEGPVGAGRGSVARVDWGTYDPLRTGRTCWQVCFHGRQVRGRFELRRRGPDEEDWDLRRLAQD